MKKCRCLTLLPWALLIAGSLAFAQGSPIEKEFEFAKKLLDDKLYSLAAKQFAQFAAEHPNHELADQALFLSGEAHWGGNEFEEAFQAFRKLELTYPRSMRIARARMRMGECQLKLQHFPEAAELFKRVVIFQPESDLAPAALLQAGRALQRANETSGALKTFSDLVKSYPETPQRIQADLSIVRIFFAQKDYQRAVHHIDTVFRTFGDRLQDPGFYELKVEIALRLAQFDEAESTCKEMLKHFSDNPQALQKAKRQLATVYEKQGKFQLTLRTYDELLAQANDSLAVEILQKKGDLLVDLGRLEAARDSYLEAKMRLAGTFKPRLTFRLAEVQRELKDDSSVQNYLAVIGKCAGDDKFSLLSAKSYIGLVKAYDAAGRYADALKAIQKARTAVKSEASAAWLRFEEAAIYADHLHDYSRASRIYELFLEEHPLSTRVDEAQKAIALCYEGLEQFPQAVREYHKYLQLFPAGDDFEWVQERVQTLEDVMPADPATAVGVLARLLTRGVRGDGSPVELAHSLYNAKQYRLALREVKQGLLQKKKTGQKGTELFRLLGLCYYQLARKQSLWANPETSAALLDSARISLSFFVDNTRDSTAAEQADFIQTQIVLNLNRSLADKQLLARIDSLLHRWRRVYPGSGKVDYLLFQRAQSASRFAAADSSLFRQALRDYDSILADYPKSKFAEAAAFHRAVLLQRLAADSTARQAFSEFVQDYPESHFLPQVFFRQAELLQNLGQYKSAIALLQRIENTYFYSAVRRDVRRKLADLYESAGDLRSALDYYERLNEAGGEPAGGQRDSAFLLLKKARAYRKLAEYDQALKNYLQYLQQVSEPVKAEPVKLVVAEISRDLGNASFAREYFSDLAGSAHQDSIKGQAQLALGKLSFDDGQFKQARQYFLSAGQLLTGGAQKTAIGFAVRCLYKQKLFKQAKSGAEAFFARFGHSQPEAAQFLLDEAEAHKSNKDFQLAEKAYKKLRKDFKNTGFAAEGEFGLGSVYLITNHTEDALKILTAIPEKYPNSPVAARTYYNLGDFYYKSHQVENAIHAFAQLLALPEANDLRSKGMLYLIQCYNDVGMWDRALALSREFLQRYPDSEHTFRKQIDMAIYLMKLKEYDRAVAKLRELLPYADNETAAEIQFYIGQCFKEQGNFQQATTEFLKVKYLTPPTKLPWHVTALFEAGRALKQLNDFAHARVIFQQIVRDQGAESNFGRFALKQLQEIDSGKLPPNSSTAN